MRGDAVLKGASTERIETLRGESHMTRSAVTRTLVALRVLIEDQAARAAADRVITLTYTIRNAYATAEELTAAREAAKNAHDDFVNTAARYLSPAHSTARAHRTPEQEPTR